MFSLIINLYSTFDNIRVCGECYSINAMKIRSTEYASKNITHSRTYIFHIVGYPSEASDCYSIKKQGPPAASPPTHWQQRQHRALRRMKKAHSVLHCSSSYNPHGQIFSFPPGRLPIQRISPLLTTLHCPDERTYPSMCIMARPTNDMATPTGQTSTSLAEFV